MEAQGGGYKQTKWTLEGLLPDEGETLSELEAAVKEIEQVRPSLSPDIKEEEFLNALKALERFAEAAHRLEGYVQLRFSENTQDQQALAFMGRAEQLITTAQNRILFFSLWWKAIDASGADRLMEGSGDLRYYLALQRLFKDYTLTEPEEKIINIKDMNGINALGRVYSMITNKFAFELEVEGVKKTLTRDGLTSFVRDPSLAVRESAYRELFRVYANDETVLGQIYINRARDWESENIGLRGFGSPMAVRNLANDIPGEVVDTLLDVCSEQAVVFHRYFGYKARSLDPGAEKLSRFDLYAPMRRKSEKKIPFPEAADMVLESFERFSPAMAKHARSILDAGHVDSELRHGKRGGAFCMSVLPGTPPWVLCNYTGEPRQVATLAHELGHGIHSLMAGGHSVLTFHPSLPLAETASVFSEMLLTDSLLAAAEGPEERRDLVSALLDDIYATVLRQAFFVLFEREAHRKVAEGCTVEDLNGLYLLNLKTQFGDSMEIDEIFKREWISIPHIYHAPFYCYAYSFGLLLSLSLYQRYREEGDGFTPRFLRVLSHGGAESPAAVLSEAGIDMADPGFWRSGFRVIDGLVKEL
jgi:oligoendopeptidase F